MISLMGMLRKSNKTEVHSHDIDEEPPFEVVFGDVEVVGDEYVVLVVEGGDEVDEDVRHEEVVD